MDGLIFFNEIRKDLGPFKQSQIDGFNAIINYGMKSNTQLDYLAYILATVWHETAFTMQPIKEKGGDQYLKSKPYYPYFGRGYVQLTWNYNYQKASDYFGVDFIKSPDLVMKSEYALPILFVGMKEGWFTGKKLSDYIDGVDEDDKEDLREFSNARRIINGTDKQVEIGEIAIIFEHALRSAGYMPLESTQKPVETPKPSKTRVGTDNIFSSLLELLFQIVKGLFNRA